MYCYHFNSRVTYNKMSTIPLMIPFFPNWSTQENKSRWTSLLLRFHSCLRSKPLPSIAGGINVAFIFTLLWRDLKDMTWTWVQCKCQSVLATFDSHENLSGQFSEWSVFVNFSFMLLTCTWVKYSLSLNLVNRCCWGRGNVACMIKSFFG